MYINELGVKEINQYYAQHGGRRAANIKGFANYIENAKASRISSTSSHIATHTDRMASAGTGSSAKTGTATHAAYQTVPESNSSDASGNGDFCCDKCQLTNQLMLRMMSNNLYTQSWLGYSALGSGGLAAYQSLSKYFGSGVFS